MCTLANRETKIHPFTRLEHTRWDEKTQNTFVYADVSLHALAVTQFRFFFEANENMSLKIRNTHMMNDFANGPCYCVSNQKW